MHPDFEKAAALTQEVIDAATEVHREMGPGLIDHIYEWCFVNELKLRDHVADRLGSVTVRYKQFERQCHVGSRLIVDGCLLVAIRAEDNVKDLHKAQLFSLLKVENIPLGLIINFNVLKLTDGISRSMIPGANLG